MMGLLDCRLAAQKKLRAGDVTVVPSASSLPPVAGNEFFSRHREGQMTNLLYCMQCCRRTLAWLHWHGTGARRVSICSCSPAGSSAEVELDAQPTICLFDALLRSHHLEADREREGTTTIRKQYCSSSSESSTFE